MKYTTKRIKFKDYQISQGDKVIAMGFSLQSDAEKVCGMLEAIGADHSQAIRICWAFGH